MRSQIRRGQSLDGMPASQLSLSSIVLLLAFALLPFRIWSAPLSRPMIWATDADRAPVLEKIETQPWARACFDAMKERVADVVARHKSDPDAFLRGLPLILDPKSPTRHPTLALIGGNMASLPEGRRRHNYQRYLHWGTDCAVLFFLTKEEAYARCAADILHASVAALVQMPRNDATESGGIVYPGDVLYEARAVGAQLPILYDFLHGYLQGGATVHDLATRTRISFPFATAQKVFRAYARLIIEHGQINSNHPVLEMPCLALNALAIDDPSERAKLLAYLTEKDTPNQDSMRKVIGVFDEAGGIWPESFQYSSGVTSRLATLTALLRRQSPPAVAAKDSARFPLALTRLNDFRFPNGENIRFGDGPRRSGQPYDVCEIVYAMALREGDTPLREKMGALLKLGIAQGRHNRARPHAYNGGAESYQGPLQLLWFAPTIEGEAKPPAPRTTDALPYAGVVLQRNLGPSGNPVHALMAAVGGASFVHSHASGMALELYGAGHVLGANAGKGTYTTDEHENYRRLFAANNCVIVNGASRSSGAWVSLGIDTVRPLALEPAVGVAPVSPLHSFTLTAYTDRQGRDARASQERLVGIVRTSATTGFYVDVFRSRSDRSSQYHDYLYHNIGDTLTLATTNGPLQLTDTPQRFVPAPGTSWTRNRSYLFPGWHVFRSARTSAPSSEDTAVTALFSAKKLGSGPAHMKLHIPGMNGREYSQAIAPVTKDAPEPYQKTPTPVLVVRQQGEAWDRPFAVLFEPIPGKAESGSIRAVTALRSGGRFAGFRVDSLIDGRAVTHYVLVQPSATATFEDAGLGLSFRGRYAVVGIDEHGTCTSLYVGEGSRLSCKGTTLASSSGASIAAFAEPAQTLPLRRATGPAELLLSDGRKFQVGPR